LKLQNISSTWHKIALEDFKIYQNRIGLALQDRDLNPSKEGEKKKNCRKVDADDDGVNDKKKKKSSHHCLDQASIYRL